MFVRYSGTKAAFIAANLESKYTNSIVFIGDGECVYTHGKYFGSLEDAVSEIGDLKSEVSNLKYFSAIKAGDVTATAAGKDGVITFNASDPSTVSVQAGTNGVTIGLTSDFVTKVNTASTQAAAAATQTALAQEVQRAQNVEGNLQLAINYNTGDINDLKGKVGNDTVSNQIDAKITALNLDTTYATKAEVEEEFKGYFTDTEVENRLDSLEDRLQDNIDAKADQTYVDPKFQDIDDALEDLNGDLEDHIEDTDVHVTAELQSKWNNAAENIAAFLDEIEEKIDNNIKVYVINLVGGVVQNSSSDLSSMYDDISADVEHSLIRISSKASSSAISPYMYDCGNISYYEPAINAGAINISVTGQITSYNVMLQRGSCTVTTKTWTLS